MILNVAHPTATVLPPMPLPALTPPQTLVLLGRDEGGRPHASAFMPSEISAAERAAVLMGFRTFVVAGEHQTLASSLPKGRVFEKSGKAFVPFCSKEAFERLLAAAGLPDTPTSIKAAGKPAEAPPPAGASSGGKGGADAPGGVPKAPADWASIGIGSTVLVCQGPMEGWWEAVVLYTKADDRFVLRWRDFPDEPEIARARKDLALMPPGSREGLG